jgi:hypothetical protein
MAAVVLDINDQLISNALPMRSIMNDLRLNDEIVSGKKKIHSRARASVARGELFGPNVAYPGTEQGV